MRVSGDWSCRCSRKQPSAGNGEIVFVVLIEFLDLQTLLAQLDSANEDKTLLTRQRDELQSQLTHVLDEVEHLQTENETLRNGGVMESLDKDGRGTQVVALKRQIQHLNDELLRSDAGEPLSVGRSLRSPTAANPQLQLVFSLGPMWCCGDHIEPLQS